MALRHARAASFDHLVGERKEFIGHGNAERFRGLEIDHHQSSFLAQLLILRTTGN
jgi:hypothetical protein